MDPARILRVLAPPRGRLPASSLLFLLYARRPRSSLALVRRRPEDGEPLTPELRLRARLPGSWVHLRARLLWSRETLCVT